MTSERAVLQLGDLLLELLRVLWRPKSALYRSLRRALLNRPELRLGDALALRAVEFPPGLLDTCPKDGHADPDHEQGADQYADRCVEAAAPGATARRRLRCRLRPPL
jgi:hypothetical protein